MEQAMWEIMERRITVTFRFRGFDAFRQSRHVTSTAS